MPLVCKACGENSLNGRGGADGRSAGLSCSECQVQIAANILPLFIVTGTSAAGKTSIVPELRSRLPEAVIMDSDLLWNRCAKAQYVNNWLRVAYSLAQAGKFTVICGTLLPRDLLTCEDRGLVGTVYFLNLHCDDEVREKRLRARPAYRGNTDQVVKDQRTFANWFLASATTAFDPPLPTFDSSSVTAAEVAEQIAVWIQARIAEEAEGSGMLTGPSVTQAPGS